MMRRRLTLRRLLSGVLAVVLGLSTLWIAVRASDSATSHRKPGVLLGALDLQAYCRKEYGARAQAVPTRIDAYGWQCSHAEHGFLHIEAIDLDHACDVMYSMPAYSFSPDTSVLASWRCYTGPRQ